MYLATLHLGILFAQATFDRFERAMPRTTHTNSHQQGYISGTTRICILSTLFVIFGTVSTGVVYVTNDFLCFVDNPGNTYCCITL